MRLKNKVALVTGGAMGIGQATAIRFAEEGAKVVISDIAESEGRDTEQMIKKYEPDCSFIYHDVTKENEWIDTIDKIEKQYGRLDILFNNAGTNLFKPAIDISEEEWDRIITLNLKGIFFGAKHSIKLMMKTGVGSIINTTSTFGMVGFPNTAVYSASKGGIIALTKQLAIEYVKYNIRVNCIAPGPVLTPLVKRELEQGLVKKEDIVGDIPMARLAQPWEIAAGVLFLASDDASYITGTVLVVDGGRTAH